MLQRAAARLRSHELDAVVVAQHANVVGDDAKWGVELYGEVTWTRNALAEPLQDACAQRMSEGLGDPGLRGLPRLPGPALAGPEGQEIRHGHCATYSWWGR